MKVKMKYISMLLVAVLITVIVAACSSNNSNNGKNSNNSNISNASTAENSEQANDSINDAIKDPYELTLSIPVFGAIPKDLAEVQAEINKITQAEINTTVTILPISIGAFGQQMNLMMSSGEKLDLAFVFGAGGMYNSYAVSGKILPIDGLFPKYGEGITEAVGAEYIEGATVDGKIYGVPTNHAFAQKPAIYMRKDLVEKHNIDVASIKSFEDLGSVFKTIKDNEPGIVPLASGLTSPLEYYRTYDRLGDGYGVLPEFDNGLKVENYYESTEYADLLNVVRDWYTSGYINKDAATTQSTPVDLVKANKAFSYMMSSKPETLGQEERLAGKELVVVDLLPTAYSTTNDLLVGLWTIAQQSENPERAMMFLDLMYTNQDIVNLMMWGVENKHYVKVSDNVIDYPTGVDASNIGYSMQAWLVSNPFISYTIKTDDPELWNNTKAYNESATKSKALGFAFSSEPVKNEITALNNVVNQYKKILQTGTIDPAKKLSEFNAKLKDAGIDKVIAEKQKQLDAWAAAKK